MTQTPLQITFRDVDHSPAIEDRIREYAAKLLTTNRPITSCRVVVESQNRRHHKGNLFHVRVDLAVPGAKLVASRDSHKAHQHEDVYVAIRDAFDAARRQLKELH